MAPDASASAGRSGERKRPFPPPPGLTLVVCFYFNTLTLNDRSLMGNPTRTLRSSVVLRPQSLGRPAGSLDLETRSVHRGETPQGEKPSGWVRG